MSAVSVPQSDHGFWEFASCGKCLLPFVSPSGATVPFWLTECGHLICNNHLNANQSCSICGSPGIQLIPLQREMEPPMSGWFESVPISLDSVANAAKFQHETMASQIRNYRARYQQQRSHIERLRHDLGDLKKLIEQLQCENDQFRQHLGHSQFSNGGFDESGHNALNSNGKRSRTGTSPYDQQRGPATTSSPRSITTVHPNRLTLPHGQAAPNLSSNHPQNVHDASSASNLRLGTTIAVSQNRPANAFVDQYAYVPPLTPQFHRPQLTHAQATSQPFKRTKPNPEAQHAHPQQTLARHQDHRNMPPPPTPARFKAARSSQTGTSTGNPLPHGQKLPSTSAGQQPQKMGGEPSSQTTNTHQSANPQVAHEPTTSATVSRNALGPTRFYPPTQRFVPPTATGRTSPAPMGNTPQRFIPSGSRAPSRAQRLDFANGGPRLPFPTRHQRDDGCS